MLKSTSWKYVPTNFGVSGLNKLNTELLASKKKKNVHIVMQSIHIKFLHLIAFEHAKILFWIISASVKYLVQTYYE